MQYIGENEKYLTAESGGGLNGDPARVNGQPGAPTQTSNALVCDRTAEDLEKYGSSWQDFTEVANPDGTVSLQIGQWFVTAERGGGFTISTDRTVNEAWQRFYKRDLNGRMVFCAYDGLHYLRVGDDNVVDCRGRLPEGLSFRNPKTAHGDPASWTDEQLLAIRGALNIRMSGASWGPRPGAPDNMASTNGLWHYPPDEQDRIIAAYCDRGYTHGPIGPFIDAGYHGQIPGINIIDNPGDEEKAMAAITKIADGGLIPVLFIQVDGWSIQQMEAFRPIFSKPWWQNYGRIVCNGFEQQGSKYGWSNKTYVEWLSWLQSMFPQAKRLLHTISDIEAPVGDGDDTSQPGMSNGECWGRVTPYIHGWLFQSNALFPAGCQGAQGPAFVADNGKTNEQNWYECFDKSYPYSFTSRFRDGYAGWPQTCAGNYPLKVYAGEYYSYPLWWIPETQESFAQQHGQKAVLMGADGSFDGWQP